MSGLICNKRIVTKVKRKVYKREVRPAMLFGLETMSLTKRQETKLKLAELKVLRWSLGVTKMDRIRKKYILETKWPNLYDLDIGRRGTVNRYVEGC